MIPPSFLSTIQNTSVTTGQLARFDAKVTGTKPLDVYWLKNGKKVTADIRYKTLEEDNTYTLLILETVPEDSGKYECVAINSAGEARCDAECTVRGPQSPAKTAKPTTPGVEKGAHSFGTIERSNYQRGNIRRLCVQDHRKTGAHGTMEKRRQGHQTIQVLPNAEGR